jgi:glutathione S-transferase
MAEYQLYCFAQSGNAYRCALMLNLIGAKWKPVWVDFFNALVQRTPEFRSEINEMGEVPVLVVDRKKKLTQSAVILTYLAKRSGQFQPQGEDEELEALRWMVFDNQKTNGFLGPYRFLKTLSKAPVDEAVLKFLKGRIDGNLAVVNKRLEKVPYMVGERPTIADVSMCAYLYFLGLPAGLTVIWATFFYVLFIALLMVSRLPVISGKRVGKRVAPEMVLPIFVTVVSFFALLVSFPWIVLSTGTVLYLACLPLGWWWYQQYKRKDAEAAASGAEPGAAPRNPDEAPLPGETVKTADEHPTRLN